MKCVINATLKQLKYIGIDRDISGMEVIFIRDCSDGYSIIKIKPPKHIAEFLNNDEEYFEEYDIPKHLLIFKND